MDADEPGELLSHTIACRLRASEHAAIQPFIESFPDRSVSRAIRWLLKQPDVVAVMDDRVTQMTRRAS